MTIAGDRVPTNAQPDFNRPYVDYRCVHCGKSTRVAGVGTAQWYEHFDGSIICKTEDTE